VGLRTRSTVPHSHAGVENPHALAVMVLHAVVCSHSKLQCIIRSTAYGYDYSFIQKHYIVTNRHAHHIAFILLLSTRIVHFVQCWLFYSHNATIYNVLARTTQNCVYTIYSSFRVLLPPLTLYARCSGGQPGAAP